MKGKRRKNISPEIESEVRRRLDSGLSVKQIYSELFGTKNQLSISSIYEIRRKAHHPHDEALRNLTRRWLNEVRQLELGKWLDTAMGPILSASKVLEMMRGVKQVSVEETHLQSELEMPLPEQFPAERWHCQVESDKDFPLLREHLELGPILPLYEKMGVAIGDIITVVAHRLPFLEGCTLAQVIIQVIGHEQSDKLLSSW